MNVEHGRTAGRAKTYVLDRCAGGLWADFLTRAGQSDEWVTAFVVLQLLRGGVRAEALRAPVARLLARQRSSGGWGYNALTPEDADSTAWCTRAVLAVIPEASDQLTAARTYLARHRRAAGYSTYDDPARLRGYLGMDADASLVGWCERSHTDVTASAAFAWVPRREDAPADEWFGEALRFALDSLRAAQDADGSWAGYWWRTPMYTTTAAIHALMALGDESGGACIAAGLEWIARTQRDDGSWDGGDGEGAAFVTGLALQALASSPRHGAAWTRGAGWLLREQRADGAWDPCPILQIPPPWVSDPRMVDSWKRGGLGAPACVADQNRLFTTSVCYGALVQGAPGRTPT
jgi:squalene cyclase